MKSLVDSVHAFKIEGVLAGACLGTLRHLYVAVIRSRLGRRHRHRPGEESVPRDLWSLTRHPTTLASEVGSRALGRYQQTLDRSPPLLGDGLS